MNDATERRIKRAIEELICEQTPVSLMAARLISQRVFGMSLKHLLGDVIVDTKDRPNLHRAAAAIGRKGGKRGGKARLQRLSAERRTEIARQAANARWHGKAELT